MKISCSPSFKIKIHNCYKESDVTWFVSYISFGSLIGRVFDVLKIAFLMQGFRLRLYIRKLFAVINRELLRMNKIYVFSGLGVDKRVFDKIHFVCQSVEFVDWIPPLNKESLQNYAKRISGHIRDENAILIGLSFGGMLSVEIAKIKNIKKVILIASAKTKYELPFMYRLIGKTRLNKLVPNSLLKSHNFMINWLFGVESKSDKLLLKSILKDTDPHFLKWAIHEILNWKNIEVPQNYLHIHGDKDRIIPICHVQYDYVISNAGHFITVNKSNEIEAVINMDYL